jgi:lysine 2,3-aminomutase
MNWEDELNNNICTVDDLKNHIELGKEEEKVLKKVIAIHPMSITRYYMSLINKAEKNDPIRKLIVPSEYELNSASGSYDPSHEKDNTKTVGLQHKYRQTALILSTNRCTAYCRFCFRKRLVGLPNSEVLKRFEDAMDYVREHKEIDNVLISGGDPLSLPTEIIEKFLGSLYAIPHLKYVRFGTRVPVVFPQRVIGDEKLIEIFRKYASRDKKLYIVAHFNHPREITDKSRVAIGMLLKAGVSISNQTVLLKGVNDNPNILAELWNGLINIDVFPYYVFQCRPVKRVKDHFSVPIYEGWKIFEEAKKKLKGHLLCKRLKYVMSHKNGKIEIIGMTDKEMVFKYHQPKNLDDSGRIIIKPIDKNLAWLDDINDLPIDTIN